MSGVADATSLDGDTEPPVVGMPCHCQSGTSAPDQKILLWMPRESPPFQAARPPDSTWVNPMSKLDADEKGILEAFESGKLKPVKNRSREWARHRKVAEATFTKDSRINIRISSNDLRALQKRALAEGMPYQLPRVDSSPAMSRSTSAPDV